MLAIPTQLHSMYEEPTLALVLPRATSALTMSPLDPAALLLAVETASNGAVVLFVGTVRNRHEGRTVRGITYHAYQRMAATRLQRIAEELAAADPSLRVALVHRLGALTIGEASVAIATSSPHREAAYEANRQALERLKREVPIWKHEHYADGVTSWREVEPLAPGR